MLIATVDFSIAPENRAAAVVRLLQDGEAIRSMKGNLAFDVYVDPVNGRSVRVWHEWQDENRFRAYSASDTFKQLGLALRPLMLAPPVSRRMTADLLETVA